MSERGDAEFLGDIKEAAARIEIYIEEMNYEQFLEDIKTQDAVVRNLEIIGEAAKNIGSLVIRVTQPDKSCIQMIPIEVKIYALEQMFDV